MKDNELEMLNYIVNEYKEIIDIHNNITLRNQELNNSYRKERTDTFKYLGTITAGAVALIPQVINHVEDFNISYPSIGQKLGGRDHTTVIHSCEKMKNDLKEDVALSQEIAQIRNLLIV